ncbi:MAG: tRNA pseudouridine(38-40) synthase TruA [Actinobacteria bacterium]|nr:tRNA pseudouridine(38-40) synthase TruA [Actinomycetota bacterium]
MLRLRIDLAYDGAPFHGFARQSDLPTVQGELDGALSRVLDQPVDTTCAGRTDRGVHATAQVVHLDVDGSVDAARRALEDLDDARRRLDLMVGPAVTIWAVRLVPEAFDARFSATERRYRYRVIDAPLVHPLRRYDAWHLGEALSVAAMQRGARRLVGEHDFASFCRARHGQTTVRRIDEVVVSRREDTVQIRVRGPAFCHQMVRSLTGALVAVGSGRHEPDWVGELLAARDRQRAPAVAPPEGLTLEGVSYGRRWPAAPPPHAR